jgi:hypothetical protein
LLDAGTPPSLLREIVLGASKSKILDKSKPRTNLSIKNILSEVEWKACFLKSARVCLLRSNKSRVMRKAKPDLINILDNKELRYAHEVGGRDHEFMPLMKEIHCSRLC